MRKQKINLKINSRYHPSGLGVREWEYGLTDRLIFVTRTVVRTKAEKRNRQIFKKKIFYQGTDLIYSVYLPRGGLPRPILLEREVSMESTPEMFIMNDSLEILRTVNYWMKTISLLFLSLKGGPWVWPRVLTLHCLLWRSCGDICRLNNKQPMSSARYRQAPPYPLLTPRKWKLLYFILELEKSAGNGG